MKFKEITLANVSTEAKVETLGIVLDKELESLYGVVNSVEAMKGDKGDKGEQGIPGKDGVGGKNGLDGKDGINGKDGVDGKDGEDGEEAPKIVDAEVAIDDTLLLTLSDGSQIKTTKPVVGERGTNGSNGANGSKGDKGDPGETGAAGVGIAVGGTTGQVLTKVSNTDYDTTWTTNGAGTVTSVGGTGTVSGINLSGTVTSTGNLTLGGTLNLSSPPAIGATTPSTVNATTLSGQTGVLRGTGQNLLLQSNTFTNAYWTNTAGALTGSQSDPFGGSTAFLLVPTVANTSHWLFSGTYGIATSPYTLSVYVKASGYNLVYLSDVGNGTYSCSYNLSAVTATPNIGCTGTITAVSGATGWYRITLTTTATISTNSRFTITGYPVGASLGIFGASFAGDGTSGIVIYGSQAEFGSTANTYIPTTTTAVYGTPTLSFSGVSTIGLQSNGALFLQPAGTGAIQAQQATSTTAGGNVRGANAVDWQTFRDNAGRVAGGTYAVIGGGRGNTCNGFNAVVGGGAFNTAPNQASVVAGGEVNTASGTFSAIVGGNINTSAGFYNFIGAGFTNSGTSGSAVTTQATTAVTSGSTAVTLSATNAAIRVGQYITGTGIAADTYVSAISSTSLTLSKNATATGTPTLSFFTPHGVVVGGGNNQATGSYSFIGGGGDAGTAANRNVASGLYSTVVGGRGNTASGVSSFVGGGGVFSDTLANLYPNTASGIASSILGGLSNTASGGYSTVLGGFSNIANATASVALGQSATTRSIVGNFSFNGADGAVAFVSGVSQTSILVIGRQTTDATATVLTSNSSAAGTTNQVILPNNSAYFFRGEVISGVTGGGNTKGWTIEGVIKRGANAASTALVGTPTVTSSFADAGAATWAIAVTADTTNGGLRVTFTGQAATTIRTVCQIRTTEMTF